MTARRALLAWVAAVCACAPVVTHAPRVDPEPSLSFTSGFSLQPKCDTGCEYPFFPLWGAALRAGYAPSDPRLPAVQGGVSVPLFAPTAAELDAFVEGPGRTRPMAYGAGVLVSSQHTMPYAQVGRTAAGKPGWYATLGYARLRRYDQILIASDSFRESVPGVSRLPRFWAPALTARFPDRNGFTDVYVAGALGSYLGEPPVAGGPGPRRPFRMLMLGATVTRYDGILGRLPRPRR